MKSSQTLAVMGANPGARRAGPSRVAPLVCAQRVRRPAGGLPEHPSEAPPAPPKRPGPLIATAPPYGGLHRCVAGAHFLLLRRPVEGYFPL